MRGTGMLAENKVDALGFGAASTLFGPHFLEDLEAARPPQGTGQIAAAVARIGARAVGKVVNDDRADWREAWALFPGSVAYIWHAGTKAGKPTLRKHCGTELDTGATRANSKVADFLFYGGRQQTHPPL